MLGVFASVCVWRGGEGGGVGIKLSCVEKNTKIHKWGGGGGTIIRNPIVGIVADDERESKNSDQIQQTNTPEKDHENKGYKKFGKQIVRGEVDEGVHLPRLLAAVLLRLAQLVTRSVSVERKENKGKNTELLQTRKEN